MLSMALCTWDFEMHYSREIWLEWSYVQNVETLCDVLVGYEGTASIILQLSIFGTGNNSAMTAD